MTFLCFLFHPDIQISREENDLMQMLENLGLEHKGILHSGIDDVKNMARVIDQLARMATLESTTT